MPTNVGTEPEGLYTIFTFKILFASYPTINA